MRAKHAPSANRRPPGERTAARARPPRVRVRVRKRSRWYRRRELRRRILAAAGVLGAFVVIDLAWATAGAFLGLQDAKGRLEAAADALLEGDLARAGEAFSEARATSEGAVTLLHHPAVLLADALPWIGDEVDAAQALSASGRDLATAGGALVDAAESSGWDGGSVPGLKPGKGPDGGRPEDSGRPEEAEPAARGDRGEGTTRRGTEGPEVSPEERRERVEARAVSGGGFAVDLEVLRLAAPHLSTAAAAITAAEQAIAAVDPQGLWLPLADAVSEARTELAARAPTVRAVSDMAALLPGFLGDGGPRRYFLAFQNLSAPRGSGGFLGVYGILEAEDGRIRLARMAGISELGDAEEDVEAPADYRARYERFGGTRSILASNYSPDFPTTGGVILDLYRAVRGEELDGVIAVDPVWLSYVLEATGPIRTSSWPQPVSSANVSRILQHDAFLGDDKGASDDLQIALGQAVIQGILSAPIDPRDLAGAVARAADERHLQVFASRAGEQSRLAGLGVAGRFEPGEDTVALVWHDATNNKAGYFARKEIDHRVALEPTGSARVTTTVTLHNRAPDGPPSTLLGEGKSGDPPGYYAAYVSLYLPPGSTGIRSEVSEYPGLQLVEREFGRPVVVDLLAVPAGGTIRLEVSYTVPAAVTATDGVERYATGFFPQPALRPDELRVEIVPSPGSVIAGTSPHLEQQGGAVVFEGAPTVPLGFWVDYRPG